MIPCEVLFSFSKTERFGNLDKMTQLIENYRSHRDDNLLEKYKKLIKTWVGGNCASDLNCVFPAETKIQKFQKMIITET